MPIHVGDTYEIETVFYVDDTPTNPSEVNVQVLAPDGTYPDIIGPDNPDTGRFVAQGVADQPGRWVWRITGSGEVVGIDEGSFFVLPSLLERPTGLCTLAEVRASLSDPDHEYDEIIQRLIDDVTDAMTREAGREFMRVDGPMDEPRERTFYYAGRGYLSLYPYDLREIVSVRIDGVDADSYQAMPNPSSTGTHTWMKLPRQAGEVTVRGRWGMERVPGNVREASIVQVREWYTRDVARFSEAFDDAAGGVSIPNRSLSRHTWEVCQDYKIRPDS